MSLKFTLVQRANPQKREEGAMKWYAVPSTETAMTGKDLTRAATANTSTAPIEMEAAMEHLANFIPQQLLQGHTVKVPGLGSFRVSFRSVGASEIVDFLPSQMIKEPRILFTPDKELRTKVISNLTFENGGVLKDGVRYASVADYRLATGETGETGGSSSSGGSTSGGDDGNNPL